MSNTQMVRMFSAQPRNQNFRIGDLFLHLQMGLVMSDLWVARSQIISISEPQQNQFLSQCNNHPLICLASNEDLI